MALFNDIEFGIEINPKEITWTTSAAYYSGNPAGNIIFSLPARNPRVFLLLGSSNSGNSEITEYRWGNNNNGIALKLEQQVQFTYPLVPQGEVVVTTPYTSSGRYWIIEGFIPS